MGKNEDVRVEVLTKICCALDCTMNDILDVIPDNNMMAGGKDNG